jgi:hypothetical protein
VSSKSEPLITLVVRRGALRRFHKLKRETQDLPVVVAWDRRAGDPEESSESGEAGAPADDRRKQQSFTWDLADFIVVPGGTDPDESSHADENAEHAPERSTRGRR